MSKQLDLEYATEFLRRSMLQQACVKYMLNARTQTTDVKIRGKTVATMTKFFKRGKLIDTMYIVPQIDWSDPLLGQ